MSQFLKDIFVLGKQFDSSTHLHSLIYIAQELKLIPNLYDFDYSLNIPFSEKLEEELLVAKSENIIVDANNGKRLQVAEGLSKEELSDINKAQAEQFNELFVIDSNTVENVAQLLYIMKNNPELVKKENEEQLLKKARYTFLKNLSAFKESFSRLRDIQALIN